jgi:predicted translin family RNA/ssDNA-binding protein
MYSLNIKLKESLLRMSREHYRSSKSVKVMSASLEQLQSALKAAEQKNRTLQHDLDELRNEGLTTALDATKEENAESSGPKVHNFGEFDEKFQVSVVCYYYYHSAKGT